MFHFGVVFNITSNGQENNDNGTKKLLIQHNILKEIFENIIPLFGKNYHIGNNNDIGTNYNM